MRELGEGIRDDEFKFSKRFGVIIPEAGFNSFNIVIVWVETVITCRLERCEQIFCFELYPAITGPHWLEVAAFIKRVDLGKPLVIFLAANFQQPFIKELTNCVSNLFVTRRKCRILCQQRCERDSKNA